MGAGLIQYSLRSEVCRRASAARIKPDDWKQFLGALERLHRHNADHFAHSLRVGMYAHDLAKSEGQRDLKFPLYAGVGHDYGKCDISNLVLNAERFGEQEMSAVREHPRLGFEALKDRWLFTAFVAGLHHKFPPRGEGYGINLPDDSPITLTEAMTARIENMARFVMIVDFYDALTTRHNDKGLVDDADDASEVEALMLSVFPAQAERVAWLQAHRIGI